MMHDWKKDAGSPQLDAEKEIRKIEDKYGVKLTESQKEEIRQKHFTKKKSQFFHRRNILLQIYTTPAVSHLVGKYAKQNETSVSDMSHRLLINALKEYVMTDADKEASLLAGAVKEGEILDAKHSHSRKLMYIPTNLKNDCMKAVSLEYDKEYIQRDLIEPVKRHVKSLKDSGLFAAGKILEKIFEIEKEFGIPSDTYI